MWRTRRGGRPSGGHHKGRSRNTRYCLDFCGSLQRRTAYPAPDFRDLRARDGATKAYRHLIIAHLVPIHPLLECRHDGNVH